MKLVLMSGGSGKRLWPLSNDQRSKQFIKILRNGDVYESMVQRVWRQLEITGLAKDTFIATGEAQRSILKSQLGIKDSQIISEPSRRDTFPAIALASCYLNSVVGISKDEMVVVLPVDPYVDVAFFEKVKELEKLIDEEESVLGLLGIEPTLPSEKYGYIIPDNSNCRKVSRFHEKPSSQQANELIRNGAVWNAGVFGFKLSTMIDLLQDMNITTNFQQLCDNYEILPKNSFDYEFSEKQDKIAFLRYEGYWKDLGTWNTLTDEMDTKAAGYTTELIDTENTHVINESNLPVAVIGVKDLIIAAGPEGIFVSSKNDSPRVKEISSEFFDSVHYVEEDWGSIYTLYETPKACAKRYEVIDNKTVSFNLGMNQILSRLSGEGTIANTGRHYKVTGLRDFNFVVVSEEK